MEFSQKNKNMLLTYMYDDAKHRVGTIQSFKLTPENYDIQHPIVAIVHSKCNLKYDTFDKERSFDINLKRMEYIVSCLIMSKKRHKPINSKPTAELKNLYQTMMDRSQRYFKEIDECNFFKYIDCFEYILKDRKKQFGLEEIASQIPAALFTTIDYTEMQKQERAGHW